MIPHKYVPLLLWEDKGCLHIWSNSLYLNLATAKLVTPVTIIYLVHRMNGSESEGRWILVGTLAPFFVETECNHITVGLLERGVGSSWMRRFLLEAIQGSAVGNTMRACTCPEGKAPFLHLPGRRGVWIAPTHRMMVYKGFLKELGNY